MGSRTASPEMKSEQVPVTLTVRQWQLDYSARMMAEQGYSSETEFLQAVLNTALLHHIPEDYWPPMSEEQKARIRELVERGEIDKEIPF